MMSTEVFRFVSIRPPRPASDATADNTIDLGQATGGLIAELRRSRSQQSRAVLLKLATGYTASADFVAPATLDKPWIGFLYALQRLPDSGFRDAAAQAFSGAFGREPADYVGGDAFKTLRQRSSDSFVAAIIDTGVAPRSRSLLVRLARSLWLVERLANGGEASRNLFQNAPLQMPAGIFPLPSDAQDLKAQRTVQAQAAKAALDARSKALAQIAADLAAQQAARNELLTTFELTGPQPVAGAAGGAPAGFLLSETAAAALTAPTKAALARIGLPSVMFRK
jgi:hypothetical protein